MTALITITALLMAASAAFLPYSCDTGDEEKNLFISYRHGGGMDMYQDGDRYGHKIDIAFDGTYTLYRLIYRSGNGRGSVSEESVRRGTLPEDTLSSIKATLECEGFYDLKERLPAGSPHEIEMRGPAPSVTITARLQPADSTHTVRANMGADRRHYPELFNELNRRLHAILRAEIERE